MDGQKIVPMGASEFILSAAAMYGLYLLGTVYQGNYNKNQGGAGNESTTNEVTDVNGVDEGTTDPNLEDGTTDLNVDETSEPNEDGTTDAGDTGESTDNPATTEGGVEDDEGAETEEPEAAKTKP